MPFLVFVLTFALAALLTPAVRWWASRRNIVDAPSTDPARKRHGRSVPLLGGIAPFLAFTLVAWGVALTTDQLFGGFLMPKHLLGITLAGLVLMVGGFLDDRKHLRPSRQLLFPIAAALVIVACGIGIPYITNPFGGTWQLNNIVWTVFSVGDTPYRVILFADLFAVLWLLATTYTTKILDGLDGLVAGITTIGGIIIATVSLGQEVSQPETAILAMALAGAALGFLMWNWHPAKIFLGEGGSTWTGFMLGTLAILAGGKIATALLILGLPALDVGWTIARRLFGHQKATQADRGHLHFRLLDVGLSHRQAVLLLYTVVAVFGSITLVTRGEQKVLALAGLGFVMLLLATAVILAYKKKPAS
ncbi:MAG: MraY family glycosyltransferase [Patescibacteria group bacterium]